MKGEGGGGEGGCLRVGRVCLRTRGDWAAVNIEVDSECGGLGNHSEESNTVSRQLQFFFFVVSVEVGFYNRPSTVDSKWTCAITF